MPPQIGKVNLNKKRLKQGEFGPRPSLERIADPGFSYLAWTWSPNPVTTTERHLLQVRPGARQSPIPT